VRQRTVTAVTHYDAANRKADTWDMSYNPNDREQKRYVDSPVVADIFMSLMGVALGFATWASLTQASPQYLAAGIMGFFALLCVFGVLSQKRRTFTFDQTTQTMSWTSRGLRENTSGTVAFKDISTFLDSMQDKQTVLYRIMIQMPQQTLPLSNAYNWPLKQAEAKMLEIRTLLGQPTDTPIDDSAAQQQRNLISIATTAGQQTDDGKPHVFVKIFRQ
jgi:hypothetical protein